MRFISSDDIKPAKFPHLFFALNQKICQQKHDTMLQVIFFILSFLSSESNFIKIEIIFLFTSSDFERFNYIILPYETAEINHSNLN